MYESPYRRPLITGDDTTYKKISDDIIIPVEAKPTQWWYMGFAVSLAFLALYVWAIGYLLWNGVGSWGLNKTVDWGWDITNFVWWVGIGHAGTLISAVLLLFRQKWRTAVNRSAEAMTIFAVVCAGVYPLLHAGRPWVIYWALPLPNTYGNLWANFNSPLLWDVFAISTYLTVSVVFWYVGLLPDLASVRDRATGLKKKMYGIFSFGWNGSAKAWSRFEIISLILAGLATPLVLSVHTIVSMDFATSVIPGWHTTIFPPYFVAGAVFSGFAMVLTLLIVARKAMKLEAYITLNHIDVMCKIIMVTGSIVGSAYITEFFIAWYSAVEFERYAFVNRMFGEYWWSYWAMMTCNVITPQLFWSQKLRRNITAVFIISIFVNIGMWFERFVIIVTSLHRDYLPSSWAMYSPTWVEISMYMGSMGLFFTLFFLFAKYVPVIAVAEVKSIMKTSAEKYMKITLEKDKAEESAQHSHESHHA
jgi:molybdopterin-containing oxidoreductase family membrane subunit